MQPSKTIYPGGIAAYNFFFSKMSNFIEKYDAKGVVLCGYKATGGCRYN